MRLCFAGGAVLMEPRCRKLVDFCRCGDPRRRLEGRRLGQPQANQIPPALMRVGFESATGSCLLETSRE
jgi:hypothetical protein